MSPLVRWLIIVIVIGVAVINPLYRHYGLKEPIVTLGLDLKGGVEVLLQAVPENGGAPSADQVIGAIEVVSNRVDPTGTKELFLSQVGTDRILLQVPGEKNPDQIIAVLGDTALLEFVNTGNQSFPEGTEFNEVGSSERKADFAKYETILTGADLEKASVLLNANKPEIGFNFKPDAKDTFGTYTTNHVGQYLAIVLDGKILSCPQIQSAIWGDGRITGTFTMEEANRIVRQLNAGALPVPLSILSASVVGPTLGQESIDSSFHAGLIGFGLVVIFMLLFYRLPGLVASFALVLYVVVLLGYFSLINATLTLPGIAGFLLSVGMAIDGNIIIFERLKEEIRWGKTLHAAMEAAFSRAWVAILDGHVTTMVAGAVLFFYGTGPVKGFATTLFLGTLCSLFSAVFVTRQFMDVVIHQVAGLNAYVSTTKELEVPSVQLRQGHYTHFIERTGLWVAISSLVILTGVGALFVNQGAIGKAFNTGIDFTGGDKILLQAKQAFPIEGKELGRIVEKYAEGEAVVQVEAADPTKASIRMRVKASGKSDDELSKSRAENLLSMKKEIGTAYGGYTAESEGAEPNPRVLEQNYVGPTVGKELIKNALWALAIGSVLVMLYILLRFGNLAMSLGAILSLVHDVLLTLALTAVLRLEINSSFIAVILTIIGYSINDTIIIYDRVRENLRSFPESTDFRQLCNLSITQTFWRSINTVVTVLIMIVALLVVGGVNIRSFMLAMLVGIISGMYSSIYIAVPLMLAVSKGRSPRQPGGSAPVLATGASGGGRSASGPEMESEEYPSLGGGSQKSGGKKQQRRR